MRADRLLAMLLLLQNRGSMTASILAEELEVSVRTIYRDIDALCTAGVPLYTDRGPGGGISLLDSFRTNLTGLTPDEIKALFLLTIPSPLAELGLNQQIKGALSKIRASIPDSSKEIENKMRQRLYIDWIGWHQVSESVPYLRPIQQAVWLNKRILIQHHSMIRGQILEHDVAPFSLVAKAGIWYLVAHVENRMRVYRVSSIVSACQLDITFNRPTNYDLATFWQKWCEQNEEHQTLYRVNARIDPQLIPYLEYIFGEQVKDQLNNRSLGESGVWVPFELRFESLEAARGKILSCGRAIEVLAPEALRMSIIDYAQQIVSFYKSQQ